MLFNSLAFAVFLPVVFALYWALRGRLRAQNVLLVAASYVFYGWWDWRFLGLIVASSGIDYVVGATLERATTPGRRRALLGLSLGTNLGLLGVFKYFDFFVASFAALLRSVGLGADPATLGVILPVGISFYTFQTLSYTIDIYRRHGRAVRDPVAFFAYVSFFPQLVAGPIERAHRLLPQFTTERTFDVEQAKDGVRQALWGLFKKVVVADNLAPFVDHVYGQPAPAGAAVALGTVYFAVQIYCDFSGYSDIAIGTARLFGFRLVRNFAYPYFARDIAEFWRRWHISLSTWFRDYVYIPLGGSRTSRPRRCWNVLVTFALSGFWHGPSWTFVAWGLLHGLYYLPRMLLGRERRSDRIVAADRMLPSPTEALQMAATFALVSIGWVFFRADSIAHATDLLARAAAGGTAGRWLVSGLVYCLPLVAIEWWQRSREHALDVARLPTWARWALYYAVATAIVLFGDAGRAPFIYFQF